MNLLSIGKRVLYVFLAAIIVQSMGLISYGMISKTSFGGEGKVLVTFATFLILAFLLWQCVISAKNKIELASLPVIFSLSYILAFIIFQTFFAGFISPSFNLFSEAKVFLCLLIFYSAGAGIMTLLKRYKEKKEI